MDFLIDPIDVAEPITCKHCGSRCGTKRITWPTPEAEVAQE